METPAILQARPGYHGQLSYQAGSQRRVVGSWLDMSDPAAAWQKVLDVQHQHPTRQLTLDVRPVKNWRVKSVQTLELKDYISGLGSPATPAPIPQPAPMPDFYPAGPPTDAAPAVQVMRQSPMPTAQEPPANMDHYGQYLFRQQEARLLDARNEVWDLKERLRVSEDEKRKLKDQLDDTKIELRYKEREHKHNLADRERELRDEYEDQEPKPSGLAGLSEVLTNPQHPLAGLLGVMATKLLGGAPGADAGTGAQLASGFSKNTVDILNGIGELIPNDEFGTKLYTALAVILPHKDGLSQLQLMAGQGVPADYPTN